eukprot:TRINITY_DN13369_c0_g1_i1.p1 TRINITY_DN13369_c0_g1~~TRINITY_DN13369_c0_g1_i1.p1  ORF type:complete len:1233 (+),score=216.78 TRINITY_DN13369_c0_g1_i1:42-3701(+)
MIEPEVCDDDTNCVPVTPPTPARPLLVQPPAATASEDQRKEYRAAFLWQLALDYAMRAFEAQEAGDEEQAVESSWAARLLAPSEVLFAVVFASAIAQSTPQTARDLLSEIIGRQQDFALAYKVRASICAMLGQYALAAADRVKYGELTSGLDITIHTALCKLFSTACTTKEKAQTANRLVVCGASDPRLNNYYVPLPASARYATGSRLHYRSNCGEWYLWWGDGCWNVSAAPWSEQCILLTARDAAKLPGDVNPRSFEELSDSSYRPVPDCGLILQHGNFISALTPVSVRHAAGPCELQLTALVPGNGAMRIALGLLGSTRNEGVAVKVDEGWLYPPKGLVIEKGTTRVTLPVEPELPVGTYALFCSLTGRRNDFIEQLGVTLTVLPPEEILEEITEVIFENETFFPKSGWGPPNTADAQRWSTHNPREARAKKNDLPPRWHWLDEWSVVVDSATDSDGWMYNMDFDCVLPWRPAPLVKECTARNMARRRRWQRSRRYEERGHTTQALPIIFGPDTDVEEHRYRNEMWQKGRWREGKVLWSDMDAKYDRGDDRLFVPAGWIWQDDWQILPVDGTADGEGWEYSHFWSGFTAEPGEDLRRRRYVRTRRLTIRQDPAKLQIERSGSGGTLASPTLGATEAEDFGRYCELNARTFYAIVSADFLVEAEALSGTIGKNCLPSPSGVLADRFLFRLQYAGFNNVYIISRTGTQLCLVGPKGSDEVKLQPLDFSRRQQWKLVPSEAGHYFLVSLASGRCLASSTQSRSSKLCQFPLDQYEGKRFWGDNVDLKQWKFVCIQQLDNQTLRGIEFPVLGAGYCSEYVIARRLVQGMMTPDICRAFSAGHLAVFLEGILQKCIDDGDCSSRRLVNFLHQAAQERDGPLRIKWSSLRYTLNKRRVKLEEVNQFLNKCRCGARLFGERCVACGLPRETAVAIYDPVAEKFAAFCRTLGQLPRNTPLQFQCTHPFFREIFVTQVTVVKQFTSKAKPLLLELLDTRGNATQVIFKTGDDLSKDAMVMLFFGVFNDIWRRAGLVHNGEPVMALQYEVLCTAAEEGIIEAVPSPAKLLEAKKQLSYTPRLLATAVGAITSGYVLGICDRHQANLLISPGSPSARERVFFHVDFGYLLKDAPTIDAGTLPIPQELGEAFGAERYEEFERLCVQAYQTLRTETMFLQNLLKLVTPVGAKADLSLGPEPEAFYNLVYDAPTRWNTAIKNWWHERQASR